jgi:putative transposase
MLPKRSTA